jgi:hypothetical protein
MPDADGHLFLFTPGELSDLVSAAGLQVEELNCWGSPMISGHCGFRFIAWHGLVRLAYEAERFAQRLTPSKRARVCAALSTILRQA